MYIKKKKIIYIMMVIVLVVGISIGYAVLNSTLRINGTSTIEKNTWDVHFENIYVKEGSIVPTIEPAISNDTTISNFELILDKPGDFYEFYVDVVNRGTIDAMINSVVKTPDLTEEQKKYINYTIEYQNGEQITKNQLVSKNSFVRLKVLVEYKKDLSASDLPTETNTLVLGLDLNIIQADNNGVIVENNGSSNYIIKVMRGTGINISDEICIKDECFYVMFSDDKNVTLISKYNLQVGNMKNENGEIVPIEKPSGLQDPLTIEVDENNKSVYGTVAFSDTNYWWDSANGNLFSNYSLDVDMSEIEDSDENLVFTYVYDENSLLYTYLENYKTYLKTQGINIYETRLLKFNDVVLMRDMVIEKYSDNFDYSLINEMLFYNNYWSGSVASNYQVFAENTIVGLRYSGGLTAEHYDSNDQFGLRPIIVIPKSEIYRQINSLITFSINGVAYQFEEGMTWEEWSNSNYNTLGDTLDSDGTLKILGSEGGFISIGPGITYVQADEYIVSDASYFTTWQTPTIPMS